MMPMMVSLEAQLLSQASAWHQECAQKLHDPENGVNIVIGTGGGMFPWDDQLEQAPGIQMTLVSQALHHLYHF
jgi:hypothetical protein